MFLKLHKEKDPSPVKHFQPFFLNIKNKITFYFSIKKHLTAAYFHFFPIVFKYYFFTFTLIKSTRKKIKQERDNIFCE
jgi:hypothetical protein